MRDTLLVIDDSELDLAILNEIFKNLFRVECASDARRGISFLQHNQERICAVLLDICLGRRGAGFTVLHQLQGNPDTAALPVILITTDANEKDVRASVERGAVDFLVKPVDPHTVQDRVCDVVRAAWPPQSTILDRREEAVEQQQQTKAEPEAARLFPQGLDLEGARQMCQTWQEKLEAFCRHRPVLSIAACRQLGHITTQLARCYVAQDPGSGLTEEDAELIGLAAVFCDVGLLGLPDHVVEAGEEQNGAEGQLYYQHAQLGWEFFHRPDEDVPLLRYASEIALWHHKNADGSGFPWDAAGDAAPLSARLVHTALRIQRYLHYYQGCADIYDRMLRALKGESGVNIDPELCRMVERWKDSLRPAFHAL